MKTLLRKTAAAVDTLNQLHARSEPLIRKDDSLAPRFTLRVEEGMVHINNISGTAEAVTFTLMALKPDGSTELITRQVSLAPFQVVQDAAEGMNALAAWSKN